MIADLVLIVIAKEPVPGRVKTRLCPPCTPVEAARLAEAALADTLQTVRRTPAGRHVLVLEGAPGPWLPAGFEVVPQAGGGLGERLAAAFEAVGGPALLIGMDTPQVSTTLLAGAGAALLEPRTDAVLGPARDGGYWAIGLRRSRPDVFENVPMSSDRTCAVQRARLRALGLHHREVASLHDVDTFADAARVASRCRRSSRFRTAFSSVIAPSPSLDPTNGRPRWATA